MAAPKTIKGITIEIAGDTKKLGAALKSIDDQSQDLAANLKYVDKLLDFDPGNTELLAEKQKLLAEAVGNTGERLEALKEVQDQVARQYQSGEIGQRAYLDFQHELAKTERKLESLKSESQKLERSLDDAGDEALDTSKDLADLGDGASGAGIDLNDLGDSLQSFVKGGAIAAVGAAIVGAAQQIGEIAEETREYREEMAKLTISYQSATLTADDAEIAYSKLYRVLGETDQSVEAAQQLARLADSTESVSRWAAVAPGLIARFGDALQPETFYESAVETYNLNEATGAFVQLLEGTAVYSVEEYEEKLASLKDKEERLAYQQMGPGAIAVDQFNTKLQSLTTSAEKQAYMLEVVESLLGDAAREYETQNESVLAARDANADLESAMGKVGEAVEPLTTELTKAKTAFIEGITPSVQACSDLLLEVGPALVEWGEGVKALSEGWADGLAKMDEKLHPLGENINKFFLWLSGASEDQLENFERTSGIASEYAAAASAGIVESANSIPPAYAAASQAAGETFAGMAQNYFDTVEKIKNTKWSVPKPKVPEFALRGKFALDPPSVPQLQVTWNAVGGIFARPMVLPAMDGSLQGFGEAGQEAILPLNSLYENLERIVARRSGPQSIVFEPHVTVYQQSGEDGEAVAQRAVDIMMDRFYTEVGGFG